MDLTPLTKKYVEFHLRATLRTGEEVTDLIDVQVAVVRHRASVDETTEWLDAQYDSASDTVTVLVTGPAVEAGSGLSVPDLGGDLYARIRDNPEDDPAFIERLNVV